jgi:hypothetical protein
MMESQSISVQFQQTPGQENAFMCLFTLAKLSFSSFPPAVKSSAGGHILQGWTSRKMRSSGRRPFAIVEMSEGSERAIPADINELASV